MEEQLFKALSRICSYNCHYNWLIKLGMFISSMPESEYTLTSKDASNIETNINNWDSEEHFIWMMLVSMFGNWGTSIRSGWLELDKRKQILSFLKKLIKDCYFCYEDFETFDAVNENELSKEQFDLLKEWLNGENDRIN